MAVTKITEKTVASTLKDNAHVLITQPENVNGSMVESLRRVPVSVVEDAITDKSVKYNSAQTLTDAQKEQARGNIGAASEGDVTDLKSQLIETRDSLVPSIISSDNFEIGQIAFAYTGWTYSSRDSRIRSKEGTSLKLYEGDVIDVVDGENAVFSIGWLNKNGTYNYQTGWLTHFECPIEAEYALMVRDDPETTVQNVDDIFNKIAIIRADVSSANELEKRVALNKSSIELLNDISGVCNLGINNFDIGNITISASGIAYSSRDSRVRTKEGYTIPLNAGDTISLSDYTDARMYIGYQKTADAKYGGDGWLTADYVCPYDGNYVILLCHSSDRRINDVSELFDLVRIIKKSSSKETGESAKFIGKFDSVDIPDLVWRNGTSASRLLSNEFDVSQYKAIKYSIPSGFQISVRLHTIDGIQFKDTGWDTTGIGYRLLIGATSAIFVMRKSTDAAISPEEVDDSFTFEFFGSKAYNYNGNIQTIGHRGCDDCTPENTLASFAKAAEEGMIWVETDVRYTSDGVAVLMHDDTINRTGRNADGTAIAETLNIADITYEQALTYDFGIFKGQSFAGQKIPTFAEFMRFCAMYGLKAVVELKGDTVNITPERCKELCRIAIKNNMKENVIWLSSVHQNRLAALTEVDPNLSFAWLANLDQTHVNEAISLKTDTNHIYIDTGETYATMANQSLIDSANMEDVGVLIWTVNYENKIVERIKYVNGIKGIATDGGDAVVGLILAND